jgi:EmrB/QacA subfamily drug resistance transporter
LPGRSRAALVAVSLALFCIQVDFFGLNLAIPDMARSFGVSTGEVQWVISGYMLSLGSLFILGGRLGDIFGRQRMLLAGVAIFGASSVLCALAPNLGALVAFRVAEGAGAALIFPVGIAVISNEFDEGARAKALGLAFAIANIGTALGPFVGGGLSQGPGWRWIFWALVPLCLLSFVTALTSVRNSRDPSATGRVDWAGASLLVLGIASLSFAVDKGGAWGWGSVRTVGLLVVALALIAGFLLVESRSAEPLVNLSLFHNLPYVMVTSLGAVVNVGYAVVIFVATLYLQDVRALSPLVAGIVFLAPATMVALAGPIGARLEPHVRPMVVMVGAAATAAGGTLALTFATGWAAFIPLFAIAGFGFGMGWTFANLSTQDVVDIDRAGEASGVLLTLLVSTGGIGLAAAASVITSLEQAGHSQQQAYFSSLRAVGVIVLAAAVVALIVRAALVRRGLMAPLSMSVDWDPPVASAE